MKHKYGILTALLAVGSLALAGGPEAPQPSFSGFYIGVGAGLSSLYTTDSFTTARASGLGGDADTNNYTYTSILYAAQVGYGWMFNNKTYLGLEGLVTYAPLYTLDETGFSTATGNLLIIGNNSIKTTSEPTYSIDAVFGYEVYPNVLPFVEAGVSFGEVLRQYTIKRTRTNLAAAPPTSNVKYQALVNTGTYNTEYNVGVGVRRLFGQHCVASTTLMYAYLGQNTGSSTVAIPSSTDTETHTRTVSNYTLSLFGTVSYLFS